MNDLPAGYDGWKAPDPPDDPPCTLPTYESGWCWSCYVGLSRVQLLVVDHVRTEVYGPGDDGESDEEWDLTCPHSDHHTPGLFDDPYSIAKHTLAVLQLTRDINLVHERPSWVRHMDTLVAEWEKEVEGEQP